MADSRAIPYSIQSRLCVDCGCEPRFERTAPIMSYQTKHNHRSYGRFLFLSRQQRPRKILNGCQPTTISTGYAESNWLKKDGARTAPLLCSTLNQNLKPLDLTLYCYYVYIPRKSHTLYKPVSQRRETAIGKRECIYFPIVDSLQYTRNNIQSCCYAFMYIMDFLRREWCWAYHIFYIDFGIAMKLIRVLWW